MHRAIPRLENWKKDWILDARLVFPEGIVVWYSPRTASQSLKKLLLDLMFPDWNEDFQTKKRWLQTNMPSAHNPEVRVAIKRDPIDRFLSAVNWDRTTWQGDFASCPDSIDKVIHGGWFDFMFEHNKHYFPQSFYLKQATNYDLIFDLQNLNNFVQWLGDQLQVDLSCPWINSTDKYFTKDMLTDKHVQIIQDKYSVDYDNGWY